MHIVKLVALQYERSSLAPFLLDVIHNNSVDFFYLDEIMLFMKGITCNPVAFSPKKIHRINRINDTVKNYFDKHPSVFEIRAVELMPLFISSGIFMDDIPAGKHILLLLRELNKTEQMHLFQSVKIIHKQENRQWYFSRTEC